MCAMSEVLASIAAADNAVAPAPAAPRAIADVWSRPQRKYRVRATVLLIGTLLLFCGLCMFTHWLHVGRLVDLSLESYWEPARFWSRQAPNLTDFILYPISVTQTPIHGVVLGLLLASIVAVPITMAILFRFPASLPFAGAVLVFAHMPWMAVTLLGSCTLAAVKPFRMRFRFGSALVGLIPVVIYLYMANGGPESSSEASPTDQLLMMAPWVLAILAACFMLATALGISRLVNYRPEGIVPVVAVMFATPVVLFHARVGVDELSYRVLESQCGPRSPRFQPVTDVAPMVRELLARLVSDDQSAARLWPDVMQMLGGQPGAINRAVWNRLLVDFLADRAEAYEQCRQFIADFPDSRYVPNVLFIQARTLDTRLTMRVPDPPRVRELYADFPHVQSESVWAALLSRAPNSSLSIPAAYRLAQLALRRGDVDPADRLLHAAISLGERLAQSAAPATQPRSPSLWTRTAPESSLAFEPTPLLVECARLAALIRENRGDPRYGDAPLVELSCLDPRRVEYPRQLDRLARRFADSALADNLEVRRALVIANAGERAAALLAIVERQRDGDALAEAMFHLSELELQTGAGNPAAAASRFRLLVDQFPGTCWALEARRRLAQLERSGASP